MKRLLLTACLAAATAAGPGTLRATAAAPPCKTSGLVVWIDTQGDGAAGSVFFKLQFTNLSGHACRLRGFPGVSAVNLHGHRLGSPGKRNTSPVHTIHLAPGATAKATLRIVQAANFPASACHRLTAAGIRVFPPNQTASKIVPFPFQACRKTGPGILTVNAVTS